MQGIRREMEKVTPRMAKELKIKCFAVGYCEEVYMCKELKGKMPKKEDFLESRKQYSQEFYKDLAIQIKEP